MPLIPADNDFAMWAVMLLTLSLAYKLEKTGLGAKIGGAMMMIIFSALLSNLNIIATSAPIFDRISTIGLPIALVLLLFNANLKKIFTESGPTLIAFCFATVGTTLGVVIGVYLLPLGEKTAELAAVFSATYIGGSPNYFTVAQSIGFDDKTLLVAGAAADQVVGLVYLIIILALPAMNFMAKKFGYDANSKRYMDDSDLEAEEADSQFSLERTVFAVGIAFMIVTISDILSNLIGLPSIRLLIVTMITVIAATFAHKQFARMTEAYPIGLLVMYLFLGMIGAGVDILAMLENGLLLAVFATIILTIHLVTVLLLSFIFKIGLPEALVASTASILAASAAAAMAGASGWKSLITPAILCGTFGYVAANFIGMSLFAILG